MSDLNFLSKKIFAILILGIGMLSAQTTEEDIFDIRKKYNDISHTLESLETKEIYELNWSTEGGDAIAYLNDNQICLIRAEWFGHMGKGIYEYYFSEGKLIFAFYTDYRYNRPFTYTEKIAKENDDEAYDPSKTVISESRLYFKNRVLFRWLDDDNNIVNGAEYEDKQKETLMLTDELLDRFRKKP